MFFKKKEEAPSVEEKLKEIEEKLKKKTESQPNQSQTQTTQTMTNTEEKNKKVEKSIELEDTAVPLFIKLEKYRTIVSSLMQMKAYLAALRNSLLALQQIEKAREDTLVLLSKNLEKMNEKLAELEKDLVKPVGFPLAIPETFDELSSVQATLSSLRAQIEQLKTELEK